MAADFNLSAEINVQLAANAANALQTQLDNAKLVVNVDSAKVRRAIKAGAKDAKEELAGDIAAIVKIKFDAASKKEFVDLFKPKTVDVTLNFKTDALAAQLDKSIKRVLKDAGISLAKLQKTVEAATKNAVPTGPNPTIISGGAKKTKAQTAASQAAAQAALNKANEQAVLDIFKAFRNLNKEAKTSNANAGKFLTSATRDLNYLKKVTAGQGGLSSLAAIFKGIGAGGREGAASARNLLNALQEMYKAKEVLGRQNQKVALNQAAGFITKDQARAQKVILKDAQKDIDNYLYSYDVSNPAAFKTTLNTIVSTATSSVSKTLRDSERDVVEYTRLLTKLKQDQANAEFNGSSPETKSAIAQQIKAVETLRKTALTTQKIRSDSGFMDTIGNVDSLKQADRVFQSVDLSLSSIARKASKSGLSQTYGGQLVGLDKQLTDIRANALAAIKVIRSSPGNTSDSRQKQSSSVVNQAKEDASVVIKRAEAIDLMYNKLINARDAFSADNLTLPTDKLNSFIIQFDKLAKSGAGLEQLRDLTERGLIDGQQLAKDEAGLNRMLLALDRVKTSLSTAVTDYANIGQKVSDVENALINDVKNKVDPRTTKDNFNKGLFDVRQANAYNLAVDKTVVKLSELGDKAKTQFAADVYQKQASDFDVFARKVFSSTPDINKALREIRVAGDHAIFAAKYDATGGFFGQIAEAAGLATKRLGAFLFFAQGLYKIQNAMEQSLSSAVALDKEFSKFEQIINKSVKNADLLATELGRVEKSIFTLAKNYGLASTEIANSGKILAQAGIIGNDLTKALDSISKASLGPTFEDMGETAETVIAIMNQFNKTGEQMEAILGGISAVAAKYPVEAEGITSGVRRAGGAFASAESDIDDFTAAFTIVKQRTREADETVATSLRNIAISLQSVKIQDFIKESTGADLLKDGRFIGFTESIQAIGKAVQELGIQAGDPRLAALIEGIAGKRQFTRLKPLIEDWEKLGEITKEFADGADSLDKDVGVALETIENKLIRAREAVTELFTELIRSDAFKFLVDGFTAVTKIVTTLTRSLVSLQGAILGIATAATLFPKLGILSNFFLSQITGGLKTRGYPRANKGGFPKYNTGGVSRARGFQPGGGPNIDSFLAELTTREYVVQRPAVEKYGVPFMDKLNSGKLDLNDFVAGRNSGGIIGFNKGGVVPGFNNGGSTGGFGNIFKIIEKLITRTTVLGGSGPQSKPSVSNISTAIKDVGRSLVSFKDKLASINIKGAVSGLAGKVSGSAPVGLLSSELSKLSSEFSNLFKIAQKFGDGVQKISAGPLAKLRSRFPDPGSPISGTGGTSNFSKLLKGVGNFVTGSTALGGSGPQTKTSAVDLFDSLKGTLGDLEKSFGKVQDKLVSFATNKALDIKGLASGLAGRAKGLFTKQEKAGPAFKPVLAALESLGVNMSETLSSKLISGIKRVRLSSGAPGSFSPGSKSVNLDPRLQSGSSRYTRVLGHEVGHAVTRALNRSQLGKLDNVIEGMPDGFFDEYTKKLEASGRYGEKGSPEFARKLKSEKRAETFRMLTERGRGELAIPKGSRGSKQLDKAEKIFAEVGIRLSKNVADIPAIIRQQGAFKGPESSIRPYSDTAAARRMTATTVSDRRIQDFLGGPGQTVFGQPGSNLDSSSSKFIGGRKGGPSSLSGFAGDINKIKPSVNLFNSKLLLAAAALAALTTATLTYAEASEEQRETFIGTTLAFGSGALAFKALKEVLASLIAAFPVGKIGRVGKLIPQTALSKTVGSVVGNATGRTGRTIDLIRAQGAGKGLGTRSDAAKTLLSDLQNNPLAFSKDASTGKFTRLKGGFADDTIKAAGKSGVAAKAAANTAAGIKTGASAASFAKVAGSAAKVAKSLDLLGLIASGLFSAFNYYSDRVIQAADISIGAAKTEAEALKAYDRKRLAGGAKNASKALGGAVGGAFTGAAIGSLIPVIGTAIGAVVGGIVGALLGGAKQFKFAEAFVNTIGKSILSAISRTGAVLLKMFDNIDTAFSTVSDYFFGTDFIKQKEQSAAQGKVGAANLGKLAEIKARTGTKSDTGFNSKERAGDLATLIGVASAGQKKRERKGVYDNFDEEIAPQLAQEAQRVKDILSLASPLEQVNIIEAAKKNGIDMVQYFKDNGVEYDKAALQASIAFDKMGLFLAGLTSAVDNANSRLDAMEAGFGQFTDPSSRQFASDKSFDVLKAGFTNEQLTGQNIDGGALAALQGQIKTFSPELSKAINFEIEGAQSSRQLQEGLLRNKDLKLDTTKGTPSSALDSFLKESFGAISGNSEVNTAFQDFLDSKGEDLSGAISSSGSVDVNKVNNLLKEFTETVDKGALEAARRINETNRKFASDYQALADQRISLEQDIIGLLNSNVDKAKSIFDIRNKASGKTGQQLLPAQRQQAAALDAAKLNNTLRGTGLGAGATTGQLGSALRASQIRQRDLETNPAGDAASNRATQQKIAIEKELQLKLQDGLKYMASGTETAALAMQEFEMAAERAARSSAFLTNALLGTDDQLMSTVKGLYAQRRIESAGNPQQAMAVLANLSSSAREGLNGIVSGDVDAANRFQTALGIAPNITGSKEAKAAEGEVVNQQAAQIELAKSMQENSNTIAANMKGLQDFYTQQFTQMQNGINMFSAVVDKISTEIKAMPSVVKHEVAGKVEVNITGAGVLSSLSPALTEMINTEVGKQMNAFGSNLGKANQGLNVPALVGGMVAGAGASGASAGAMK